MRTNGGPTWRHVAAALGVGILIGIATTNNFYSLSAARPSTEFHESPHAPPPLAPYYPPKQPKPYTPAKRVVRREKGEEPQTYKPTTTCLLYTSPSPRDATLSRMPSSA